MAEQLGELGRAELGDASEREPAEAIHLGPLPTRAALDEAALAAQLARVEAIGKTGEQVQVLLRGVGVAAEIEQGLGAERQAGFFAGFAQRRFTRTLADVDAALGQIPMTLTGDVAEQQLARLGEHRDAAAEPARP